MKSRSDWPDQKPTKRGECLGMPRPCPFVSCRHHIVKIKGPGDEGIRTDDHDDQTVDAILAVKESCSLDVADRVAKDKELSLAEVGEIMGFSRERARQVEMLEAAPKMRKEFAARGHDFTVQRGCKTTSRLCEPLPIIKKGKRFFYPDAAKLEAIAILDRLGAGVAGLAAAGDAIERATGKRPGHGTLRAWRRAQNVRP
jgi:hypothetical protein